MKHPSTFSTLLAAALGGLLLLPTTAATQSCMGLPLDGRSPTALGQVAFLSGVTQYGVRVGREVAMDLSANADLVHASFRRASWEGTGRKGSGQAIGATGVYSTFLDEFPICSFLGLRYAFSSARWSMPGWEPDLPAITYSDRMSGILTVVGMGTGAELAISPESDLIPFGNARVGWIQKRTRQHCSPAPTCGSGYEHTDGLAHVEAEIGLLLRYRRFVLGGAARGGLLDSDPLLQFASGTQEALIYTVTAGMTF